MAQVPILSTKNVKIPVELERAFNSLPNRDRWAPAGFPDFVRDAVRRYLDEQERLVKFGAGVPEEEGRTQAEVPPDTRSHRK